MNNGKITGRTVVGRQRLDQAVGSLLSNVQAKPVDRFHLEHIAAHFSGRTHQDRGLGATIGGLARVLEDRMIPQIADPSVLERNRMIKILRDIGDRLRDPGNDDGTVNQIQVVARNLVLSEAERLQTLHARIGELLES